MEIDYHEVLGLPKTCSKKEIVQAYLKSLQGNCSPEQRKLFDRALVVLRIGYLTYVHQKRGEAGLRERRSSSLIERCTAAVAALSKRERVKVSMTSWNDESETSTCISIYSSFFEDSS